MASMGEAADVGGPPQGGLFLGGGSLANTGGFLKGIPVTNRRKRRNNRSVMPLDVLGRTRATLMHSSSLQPWPRGLGNLRNMHRAGDRLL